MLVSPSREELRAWLLSRSEEELRAIAEIVAEATHTYAEIVRSLKPEADERQVEKDIVRLRVERQRGTGRVPDPVIPAALAGPRWSTRQVEQMREADVLARRRKPAE